MTVLQRNYLEVYIYEKWSDKEIIDYESVREFDPTSIELNEGVTEPPQLLTEADLIALVNFRTTKKSTDRLLRKYWICCYLVTYSFFIGCHYTKYVFIIT